MLLILTFFLFCFALPPYSLCLVSLPPSPLLTVRRFLSKALISPFLPPSLTHVLFHCAVMPETQAEGEESAELNTDAQLGQRCCLQGDVCVVVCHVCSYRACVCVCVTGMRATDVHRRTRGVIW